MVQSTKSKSTREEVSLKPCPFCGENDATLMWDSDEKGKPLDCWYVWCLTCGGMGSRQLSIKGAEDAWNNRAGWTFSGNATPVPVYNTTVVYERDEIIDRLDTIIELLRKEWGE